MLQWKDGSLRLFRLAGINVYLHWSWVVIAFIELQYRTGAYQQQAWNVAEYLTLFGIVLLHEFGHALACRQVGGTADRIMLWPLGGIAYVSPPPRPGAVLWSIAAGPLVNVVLVPITFGLGVISALLQWKQLAPDADHYLRTVAILNGVLLVFNLLPIYPLDGGQILQALLWFVIGRAHSLLVTSVIGLVAGLGVIGLALAASEPWLGILAVFTTLRSWSGFQQSRALLAMLRAPRHHELACPSCGQAPIQGPFWICDHCRARFDTFEQQAVCPECGVSVAETMCPECSHRHPIAEWYPSVLPQDSPPDKKRYGDD